MTDTTQPIAQLRHLYQNMVNGGVQNADSAKQIAKGLLGPAIEAHVQNPAKIERGAGDVSKTPQKSNTSQAPAVPADWPELQRLANCCPELNLSNYGPDDVDELNAWAIEVSLCIARTAAAPQPSTRKDTP
jgi:hypothetical protein